MSDFIWTGGSGSFSDPNQWWDDNGGMVTTGEDAPGGSDFANFGVFSLGDDTYGATSGDINGSGSALGGQAAGAGGGIFNFDAELNFGADGFSNNDTINITGGDIEVASEWQNIGGVLNISAGLLSAGSLESDSLSAITVSDGTLKTSGTLRNEGAFTVSGGEVDAGYLEIDSALALSDGLISVSGTLANYGNLTMTGGSITAATVLSEGVLSIGDGSVHVTAALKTVSSSSLSVIAGGSLTVDTGLTLVYGAKFSIAGGGQVTSQSGDVSNSPFKATVDGTGSKWTVTDALTVGNAAAGVLAVTAGGAVSAASLTIGAQAAGTVTLDGAGTELQVSGTVAVGGMGQATLNVQNGAVLDAPPDLDIAPDPPPENAVPVIDPITGFHTNNVQLVNVTGGTLDAGSIDDGDAGYGKITTDGGTVDATDDVTLGDQANAEGQILLDGDDAELDTGDLTVGNDGKGLLNVGNGNTVTTDGDATLADGNGSLGTMTLGDGTGDPADQASWSISGGLTVAGSGKATLLTNNAMLSVSGDSFVIGDAMGSNGLVTMNASTLSTGAEIVVGNSGKGELLFQLGSTVDTGDDITAPGFTVGALMGGSGSLIASGANTLLNATTIEVGAFGKGTLQVTQAAVVQASGAVDIATQEEGVIDAATVSTGGYLGVATDLTVGSLGVATLQVLSGGQVADQGDVTIADTKGSSAVVTVSGTITTGMVATPSSLGFGHVLTVGHDGIGTLLVEDGGLVGPLSGGAGTIEIGAQSDGQGTVTVSGTGSLLKATHIDVGGTDSAAGGAAVLTVKTGGTVEATQLTVWSTGAVKLAGGALQTDPLTISGGDISGDGTIGGDLTDDGSITATGGVLTLSGNVSGTGTLLIDDAGTLALGGTDTGVDVGFVAGGSNEVLSLATTSNLAANITGFIAGDAVDVADLQGATVAYGANGATTTLTFANGPTPLGSLTFTGHYSQQQLAFDPSTGTVTTTVPCFAAGTLILAARGLVAVEDLVVGEEVTTISGRLRPIRWIGRRHVQCRRAPRPDTVLPIRIAAHAFGPGRPCRDLFLSPDHAVFAAGVMIPIKHLVNRSTVARTDVDAVTYYHIELPRHDVVLAENLPVETYLDTGNRRSFAHGGAAAPLPDADRDCLIWEAAGYAPLVVAGPLLAAVEQRLRRRIAALRGRPAVAHDAGIAQKWPHTSKKIGGTFREATHAADH